MPFSVLRGGDQCDEVTDGGDVIGKAAGFSSAMAVKCAIKVEMETSWGVNACISMDPFLFLLNVQCCPHPLYFSTKFFAASISHNHFPQNILLPSPCLTSAPPHTLPSLLNFRSLHNSQSLSTNQFAAFTLQSLLKLSFCILCCSPIPALKILLCKACIAIDVGLMWGNRGTGGDFPMFVYLILLFVNDLSINV